MSYANLAEQLQRKSPIDTPIGLQMICLFGSPGSGKSTLAASFPNHIYYDLEASAVELDTNQLPLDVLPRTWAGFKQFITELHQGNTSLDGSTLVIDTVTDLWDMCVRHELAERKMAEMPDDYGRTLTAIRKEFTRTLSMLLSLRMSQRLGSILIAHEDAEEIKTPTAVYHIHRPRVSDKTVKGWVAEKPQMVLRAFTSEVNPVSGEAFGETKFLLKANPTAGGEVVKDRTRKLPTFLPLRYDALEKAYSKNSNKPQEPTT